MYTLIGYTHELWFHDFLSTGLLLQSIWTLTQYLKPKVGGDENKNQITLNLLDTPDHKTQTGS